MIAYLLTIGFISILGQVVILRELSVAFYGIELIYILAIGIWLFWTAAGAVIGRRSYVPSAAVTGFLFVLFAVLLPVDVAFIRGARIIFGGIPGTYLPFTLQLAAIALALCPIGILLGLLFQWATKRYIEKNKTLALAYAIESAGGLIGGLASTLLLKFGVQNFMIAVLCSLLTVGMLILPGKDRGRWLRSAAFLIFGFLMVVLWLSPQIDDRMTRWNHPNLLDTRDSPYSRITITHQEGQYVVFENDVLGLETESVAGEELVHLAALHPDSLGDVLILGGGVDGLLEEILKHNPWKIDYVELNPALLELARKHLPESFQAPLESGAVTVTTADPRSFIEGGSMRSSFGSFIQRSLLSGTCSKDFSENAGTYDLILVGMPDPTSGQSNRFYTRDFFEVCASRLNSGGVLAFRLRSSENIWTQFITYRNTSIYRSLKSVFQDVVILPGVTNTVIASDRSLSRDPDLLSERFIQREIKTRLITPAYINYLYTNDRFFDIAQRLVSTNIPPNTDIKPVCYRFSSMIWLSKFFPRMIHWDITLTGASLFSRAVPYGVVICLGVLFFLARRWRRLQRIMLVALAGFIGMVLESILILHYQVKSGVLFQNIGILLMIFMGGLAAGSIIILEASKAYMTKFGAISKKLGIAMLIGFAILNLVYIGFVFFNYPAGIFVTGLLMFLTGFLVSGVFAYTSLSGVKDQKIVVSPLYAGDLVGGCIGSLLGSLLLIPLLGMGQSAGVMAVLALVGLLLF